MHFISHNTFFFFLIYSIIVTLTHTIYFYHFQDWSIYRNRDLSDAEKKLHGPEEVLKDQQDLCGTRRTKNFVGLKKSRRIRKRSFSRQKELDKNNFAWSQPKKSRRSRRREENREKETRLRRRDTPSVCAASQPWRRALFSIKRSRRSSINAIALVGTAKPTALKILSWSWVDSCKIPHLHLSGVCILQKRERKKNRRGWQWHELSNVVVLRRTAENRQRKNDAAPDPSSDVSIELCQLIGH